MKAEKKVSAVARRHGLTPQQLFGWRRDARRRTARRRARSDGADASGSAFAPVIVEAALPSSEAPIAPGRVDGAAIIEIMIGAATVRVAPEVDAATLITVLRAVKAAT